MPAHASNPVVTEVEPALASDAVDPELVGLPDPPRHERRTTIGLLAVAAVASLAMVGALSRDASYALSPSRAVALGDLRTAPAESLRGNAFVEGQAMLAGGAAIRYEHPFERDSYRLAPVSGRDNVWVEARVPVGEEGARYVPATQFKGRLIPFEKAGLRHRGLVASVKSLTGQAVPEGAWLLVDGQAPGDARGVAALMGLFLLFAAWNVATIAKLARKLQ